MRVSTSQLKFGRWERFADKVLAPYLLVRKAQMPYRGLSRWTLWSA